MVPHARQAASINLYLFFSHLFFLLNLLVRRRAATGIFPCSDEFVRIMPEHGGTADAVQFANVQIATPKINMDGKILRPRRFGLVGRYICIGIPGIPISQLGTASRELVGMNFMPFSRLYLLPLAGMLFVS